MAFDDIMVDTTVDEQSAPSPEGEGEAQGEGDVSTRIPDKFKGKSLEEVVDSYQHLEKEIGRKGQEIGELRRLTDRLLQHETSRSVATEPKEPEPDFFEDPAKAVKKILSEELRPLKEKLSLSEQQHTLQKIQAKHPDWQQVVTDNAFQEWITGSPTRLRLYREADTHFNFNSADELLSNWKERKQVEATKQVVADEEKKRRSDLKSASVESGRTLGGASKKVYRRADLIRLRIEDPGKYNDMQDDIMKAYHEGRVK